MVAVSDCSQWGSTVVMNDENAHPTENPGPVDPEMVRRAKQAQQPSSDQPNDPKEPAEIDPDSPARAVLFPDEDPPEPNEPG
jgi:hypothetical protein